CSFSLRRPARFTLFPYTTLFRSIFGNKIRSFNTTVYIINSSSLGSYDMEVSFKPNPGHANGIFNTIFIIHSIILGHNVYNGVSWGNHYVFHVIGNSSYVLNGNLIILGVSDNYPMMHRTSDMLPGNSNDHF